jgi:hypothetical protein
MDTRRYSVTVKITTNPTRPEFKTYEIDATNRFTAADVAVLKAVHDYGMVLVSDVKQTK